MNPNPSLEEKKDWIESALSICKLNKDQYVIVESQMLHLMLRLDQAMNLMDRMERLLGIASDKNAKS